ncbi:MAG: aldolase [Alphaproteobacteria bacterium]|nr:aldolase [Alphaproteobacteria bacterium]
MYFKEALDKKQPVGCFWLSLGSIPLAEFIAETSETSQAPLAVVFDMQHGLWDRMALENAIGLIKTGLIPLVRVADCDRFHISGALDAGAEGVIVPLIETAEQAQDAVQYANYPPEGTRSAGGVRPIRDFAAYVDMARKTTAVALMIETRAGLDNIAEIIETPGLDMIFIGTGDLCLSLGLAKDDPALEQAIGKIKRTCDAANVPCGIFTPDVTQAKKRREQGFLLVVISDDITANRNLYQEKSREFTAD